jgi:hypothetical protein
MTPPNTTRYAVPKRAAGALGATVIAVAILLRFDAGTQTVAPPATAVAVAPTTNANTTTPQTRTDVRFVVVDHGRGEGGDRGPRG